MHKTLATTMTMLVLSSCSAVQNIAFQRPEAELQAIEITSFGLTGGSLNLLLDVYNPNQYDVTTLQIDAGLDLEGIHFGDMSLERDILLVADQHTEVQIPFSFTWAGVGAGARALLEKGALDYTLTSSFRVGTPLGEQTIRLDRSGLVPLKDLP